MTAPERRRPLPALAFIGALSLLTALVWFRVLHRTDSTHKVTNAACRSASASASASASTPPVPAPTVLPVPSIVTVLVLNSTQRNKLAATTSKSLDKLGFKTRTPEDDGSAYASTGAVKGVAEIRYPASAIGAATLLKYYFPGATMKQVDPTKYSGLKSLGNTPVVAVGAKYKKIATTTAVHRAIAAAHLKQSIKATPSPRPTPTTSLPAAC